MKSKMNNYFKFIMYLLIVILINIAGISIYYRYDLTSNKVFSLSGASKEAVGTLSEPLTVKIFFTRNLPAPYNNIERYLHDLLKEYSIAGNKYFNYQFYNVSVEDNEKVESNQDIASNYGIYPVQLQHIEQDKVKFQKAYMGMVMIHGDIIETVPTITSTEGLEYEITSSINKMNNKISALLNLKNNVSVNLFLSSSLQVVGPYMNLTGLGELPEKIKNIVNELNEKNYNKLSFCYVDPTNNPDGEKEAENNKIIKLQWDEFKDRRGKTISADNGYAGLLVEHGEKTLEIQLINVLRIPLFGTQYELTNLDDLENIINEAIGNVIDINQKIAYLSDHDSWALEGYAMPGQSSQAESLSNFNKLLSENYSIKQVTLKENLMLDGLSCMIIAGAKENFTEYDLYQIDQFLMKGKNLAIFMDAYKQQNSPANTNRMMSGQNVSNVPLNTGLEKLLKHYGFNMKQSFILDENCYRQRMPQQFGGGERPLYFVPIIRNERINKNLDFMQTIKGLIMLKTAPVEIIEKNIKEQGLTVHKLFSSSKRSWELSGNIDLNPMLLNPPKSEDKFKSMPLAYILEGSFSSYFSDKQIPEKDDKKNQSGDIKDMSKEKIKGIDMSQINTPDTIIKKGKPGKIFLIGTSEILRDNIIDDEGKTPNSQFVMNVIDYLNNREKYAVMRSKSQGFNPLMELTPVTKTTIKFINIAGLPILVIIAGLFVWFGRASRKRTIQKMFQK